MLRRFVFLLTTLACCLGLGVEEACADHLVVIVNARAGVATMTRNEVANVFLGRARQFFNGVEVQAIDLADGHADRVRFYRELLGRDVAQVDAYWSRQLFSGRMQPLPRAAGSDEVLRWVLAHPGGIGYIESDKVDARVRVIHEFDH